MDEMAGILFCVGTGIFLFITIPSGWLRFLQGEQTWTLINSRMFPAVPIFSKTSGTVSTSILKLGKHKSKFSYFCEYVYIRYGDNDDFLYSCFLFLFFLVREYDVTVEMLATVEQMLS